MRLLAPFLLAFMAFALSACEPANVRKTMPEQEPANGRTEVFVMGMLHASHKTSKRYSLEVIRETVNAVHPDIILTELPATTYRQALAGFAETGRVTDKRARAFPEYTDAIIPMTSTHDFAIIGTAGWTPAISAHRNEALASIARDPARGSQWLAWQRSQAAFRKAIAGHQDDPQFIHSTAYDDAVRQLYLPYMRYFDRDLGPGGWDAVNRAHWANIARELDQLKGQKKRVLITYGAYHKHRILDALAQRDDVIVRDIRPCFPD